MEYYVSEFPIEQLYDLVDKDKIDLNPSYQRNFIWSTINQKELIDTILLGYPLPSLFLYAKGDGNYEMVDGQQRTKTIYRFIKGIITSSKLFGGVSFNDIDTTRFLAYRLSIIVIKNLLPSDSLQDFYVLINKKGVHLNTAEVNKSEFHDTNFLRLANDLLSYQNFIDLNLFTEAATKRMNDRAYVEELLGYLISGAAKDKKKAVASLFNSDISHEEYEIFSTQFKRVIDEIHHLNTKHPIDKTRYKQKNDFYTLFSFINESEDSRDILEYQYEILLILDGRDDEGRQFIRPSNEECLALKEYANNCITQSNSKYARDRRLSFFNSILKNTVDNGNDTLVDVLTYLSSVYGEERINFKTIGNYNLLDVDSLKEN
ncbi:DUF262 domain-containing protein [Dyadobacter sandarakinus]|uniref:DUF262 domain-containing protein n=1 Tax=Dyadobacter sandarakinus TaxID=2747268 RepID=A0ABX7I6H9_9BACT|nr:DUF262 domain-containing protein [Dyadobacter sandarakinus]QRR01500.1 DUF262 domain-containing protein [Dyadobacter sandarakinus]